MDLKFTRHHPKNERYNLELGTFRINSKLVKEENNKTRRNKWWRIKSRHTSIYRILNFNQHLKTVESKEIDIDWYGWVELNGLKTPTDDKEIDLIIEPIKKAEYLHAAWNHPDQHIRLALRISIGSALITVVLFIFDKLTCN
jgi:hypothetical protein